MEGLRGDRDVDFPPRLMHGSGLLDALVLVDPLALTLKDVIRRKGYKVICVFTLGDQAVEGRLKPHVTYVDRLSTNVDFDWAIRESDIATIVQKLKDGPFNIKAVIPGSCSGVASSDRIAEALGLPHNDTTRVSARRDKSDMKEAALAAGLRCADFKRCRTESDLLEFMSSHHFPVILKTPAGAFTSDVHVCGDMDALLEHHRVIVSRPDIWGKTPEFSLIEEFLSGTEYAVNLFADGDDVRVTDIWCYEKAEVTRASKWNFGYHAMLQPPDSPTSIALAKYAVALAKAVGIRIGPAHAEIKIDKDGPVMIEIGARLAGAKMPLMTQEFSNFDPVSAMIDVFVEGRIEVDYPVRFRKSVAIGLFPTESSGELKQVVGIDEIEGLPSYHSHFLNETLLNPVIPTTNVGGVPLIVWMAHGDPDVLRRDIASARTLFRLDCA
jgi:L-amino acid ligase